MSDFEVLVVKIDNVEKHPDADRLDLITIGGYIAIANKNEDGSSRYKTGDLVVYIPEGAVLPEWMMKQMDFWDVNKNKPAFRYVKAKKLRGIFSQGILYPVDVRDDGVWVEFPMMRFGETAQFVQEGDNVTETLGISKYEPVVPASMSGQMSGEYIAYTMSYNFESIQKHWNMFEEGEWVSVSEKLHGTNFQIGYVPGLNDPLLFGNKGAIYPTSKGVGARGFIYKNLDANAGNLYVETLRKLLALGLEDTLEMFTLSYMFVKKIHLFGEIFGAGVQDLTYGFKTPTVQFFDIAIDGVYLSPDEFVATIDRMQLPRVPLLYEGPFDKKLLEELRDGQDSISGTNIREGIVIKGIGHHPKYGRKVAKWVSPEYALRKNGTEFN